ncbi:hypothetical protein ACFL2V_02875 [Pseudomonadota bacterium]
MFNIFKKAIGATVVALTLSPIASQAALISGDGLASSAISGATVEDFSGADGFSGTSLTLGDLEVSADGFSVSDFLGGGANQSGPSLHATSHLSPAIFWTFSFANPLDAFAFNIRGIDSNWSLSAYNDLNELIESFTIFDANAQDYYGISGGDISYATLSTSHVTDFVLIDNFTYRASASGSVPTPTPFALLGLGLLMLGINRRARAS